MCTVDGCEQASWARGLCGKHYLRWRRHGDPLHERATVEERFWSRVDRSGGPDVCWPWTGGIIGGGYGHFSIGRKNIPAHRMAYDLAHPDDPLGPYQGLHTCDNPPCCNPAHILKGTHQENMTDRQAKGRQSRGARHGEYNRVKTHCPKGHPYDEANTYLVSGKRMCRACAAGATRRYRERKKHLASYQQQGCGQ